MNQNADSPDAGPAPRISRRKSLTGIAIALVALALLGWLAWHLTHPAGDSGAGRSRRMPPATTVGVATVEQADIPVTVEALGTVTASAVVTVHPQVSGVLKEVHFSEGEAVRAGQLLATLDARQFEMALLQATGQRQRDEAQLANARLVLERYRSLLALDSIARQEVDTQAALVKQLEGTVKIDRAAEGTAKLNLGYTRITAPISGRIGLRAVDVGNLVGPSDTTGIADITQMAPIDVEFSLPQDLVPQLRSRLAEADELPVTALDRSRENVLDRGKFLALDNQVDTQTGTVRAKGRFLNPQSTLFPSQFVNVRLLLRTIPDAAVVPVAAVRHGSNGNYVYVLNAQDRTVALRAVTTGQVADGRIEITTGLKPGEQVITEGADRLKDGARVSIPDGVSGAAAKDEQGPSAQRQRDSGNDGKGRRQPAAAKE